jgi:SAM-dependent methyltransferase
MDDCLLYSEPELYDLLFPSAHASATVQDAERRKRIVASESFYLEEAGKGGRVLELACGTGRLTVPIAQRGVEIVGIDSSPTMLEIARAKAAASGAPATFVQADMRAYDLAQRFGLIFIAGNSLQHMLSAGDLTQCFACVRRHLAAGGRLVFDVSNPDPALLARDPNPRYPVMQVAHPQRGLVSLEETARYEPATGIRDMVWYFSAPGAPDFRVINYRLRMIFPLEIEEALADAGLRMDTRYGEYWRLPFEPSSPRQVYLCSLPS